MSVRLLLGLLAATVPGSLSAQGMVQPLGLTDADRLATQMRQLAANPRDLNALATAGELSLRVGDLSGAAALFARADKVDPRSGRVKAGMAAILVRSERPGEALRFFGQAEAYGWPVARFAADRGMAYDLIGQQDRAQRDYRLALRNAADDETARRYGLSLGISGRQKEALEQLDPLVRRQDRAAWRARAFVLAMGGDTGGAAKIATAMMPATLAQGLGAFFGRLPTLGPVDRAFAVHFGEVFATPERLADARLVPTLAPLGPEPGVAPVQVAAAVPMRDRRSRRERERDQRRERERAVALARATTRPVVVRPALPPATQVAAVLPRALPAMMRETNVRVAGVPIRPATSLPATTSVSGPPASLSGPVARPAIPVTLTAAPTVARPARIPASTSAAITTNASPGAVTGSSTPVALAAAPVASLPASIAPPVAAAPPLSAVTLVAVPAAGSSLPENVGGAVLPTSSGVVATTLSTAALPTATGLIPSAGVPVTTAASLTTALGNTVPVAAVGPSSLAAAPVPAASIAPIAARSVEMVSSAPASMADPPPIATVAVPPSTSSTAVPTLAAAAVAGPPAPVLPVETAAATERADSVLARIVASLSIPASELGIAPVKPDPAPVSIPAAVARVPASPAGKRIVAEAAAKEARDAGVRRTVAAKLTGDAKTDDPPLGPRAKRAAAAKALADKKAADEKKALAAAAAEEKRIARTKPARIWVQVAGGANEAALAKTWRTAQNKAPALKARTGYSTPLRATNRVLTGPFKTEAEARTLINQLAREGVSAFSFTSEAGQDVKTLGTK